MTEHESEMVFDILVYVVNEINRNPDQPKYEIVNTALKKWPVIDARMNKKLELFMWD